MRCPPFSWLGLLALGAACRQAEPQPSAASSAASEASAASVPSRIAAFKAEARALQRQLATERAGRQVRVAEATLVSAAAGPKHEPRFRITNRSPKRLVWLQAWVVYFDAAGVYLDRFPQALETEIAPGATVEKSLGYPGDQAPKTAKVVECDISMVEWDDGSKWANENLEPTPDRKPGGLSQQELARREGEMVVTEWTGGFGKSQRPLFLVANVSGRPLEIRSAWSYYYADNGEQLDRQSDAQVTKLERDAVAEVESGTAKSELEPGTRSVELAISAVRFTDGAQETWSNENLSASDRPPRTKPKP